MIILASILGIIIIQERGIPILTNQYSMEEIWGFPDMGVPQQLMVIIRENPMHENG